MQKYLFDHKSCTCGYGIKITHAHRFFLHFSSVPATARGGNSGFDNTTEQLAATFIAYEYFSSGKILTKEKRERRKKDKLLSNVRVGKTTSEKEREKDYFKSIYFYTGKMSCNLCLCVRLLCLYVSMCLYVHYCCLLCYYWILGLLTLISVWGQRY